MRIRNFGKFLEVENLKDHKLQNCTVVVDAQNFFYQLYQRSGLQYIFGCESDKYADYLKKYLDMFKKANVNCFFVFKGGHRDFLKRLTKLKIDNVHGRNFNIKEDYDVIVLPILMKDVYKQVLDEMGFDYTYCEFESKKECIALAQKLNCPVISNDIEFAFAGVPYIIQATLKFECNNRIHCGMFSLDEFLKKYRINEDKLALFAALTDERHFPENYFLSFIKTLKIPLGHYKRNIGIIQWLYKTQKKHAVDQIIQHTREGDREKFLLAERKVRNMIRRQEEPGIPTQYLLNGNRVDEADKDPCWFEKGVAAKHIAVRLINPIRSGIVEGSSAVADYDDEDPLLLSIDIIKFTYNLLTNFKKKNFIFFVNNEKIPIPLTDSIHKPYEARFSPFENGWNNLKGDLFTHFLKKSLQGLDLSSLGRFPEDARMLMIALIYLSKKKSESTINEVCAVLLSYVALNAISEASTAKQKMDAIDKQSIADVDKQTAKALFAKYRADVNIYEARKIFNAKLLHPLVEFQHCLQHLNFLNVLCGKLYEPTVYSKTYNGSFVYKVLHDIKTNFKGECMKFLEEKLNSAPTVYAFLKGFLTAYDDIIAGIE